MQRVFLVSSLFLLAGVLSAARQESLSHGPLVGHVGAERARIWARAGAAGPLRLVVLRGSQVVSELRQEARPEEDLCVVFDVEGLEPGTAHAYELAGARGWFETAPRAGEPSFVRIAFGSCAREDESTRATWERMAQSRLDALVLLGDTPYIDSTELAVQRRRHREFLGFSALKELCAQTPLYATWDDHDFGRNDTDGRLSGKENARRAFVEYHANPSAGDGKEGIYTSFRRGPVEVFLLDTRTFAATEPSPFDGERPTLLGQVQWRWLEEGLRASDAPFKVLACGMIWNGATRPNKPDHWMSYPHEREALFRLLGRLEVSGVLLVGGDIHRSRLLRHPTEESVGYPLWEWITSPMHGSVIESANAPHPALVHDAGEPNTFLLLDFDTRGGQQRVTGTALNAAGETLFTRSLAHEQLARARSGER